MSNKPAVLYIMLRSSFRRRIYLHFTCIKCHHLSLHSAVTLHAPVLDLFAKHIPSTSILVAVLITRQIITTKTCIDATVEVAAGVMVSDLPELAGVQREVEAIPVPAITDEAIVDLFPVRHGQVVMSN